MWVFGTLMGVVGDEDSGLLVSLRSLGGWAASSSFSCNVATTFTDLSRDGMVTVNCLGSSALLLSLALVSAIFTAIGILFDVASESLWNYCCESPRNRNSSEAQGAFMLFICSSTSMVTCTERVPLDSWR
jgi:hypothetical protein